MLHIYFPTQIKPAKHFFLQQEHDPIFLQSTSVIILLAYSPG